MRIRLSMLAALAAAALPLTSHARVIVTEVIPGVNASATNGDTIELFNTGPGAVDLTDWRLTDLDPGAVESSLANEPTFAPMSAAIPPLAAGEYAVVILKDDSLTSSTTWQATNYGLRIEAPLALGGTTVFGNTYEQLLLVDAALVPQDFLAWHDTGASLSPTDEQDAREDLQALTGPTGGYGITPGLAEWSGPDTIATLADYQGASVDFTGRSEVTTWGSGAIRRRSVGETFQVSSPGAVADWEAIPRERASLGNPSDDVATAGGLRPIRVAASIAEWIGELDASNFPERRIARGEDLVMPDFQTASLPDRTAFQNIVTRLMTGDAEGTFADALAQGYEVVEFLDLPSGRTWHILRERVWPGEPGFRGQGIFIVDNNPDARAELCLQAPHPIFDGGTSEQLGIAMPELHPRVAMIAGTHRNNSTVTTPCDGTFEGGAPYRISDPAHHPDNFFHAIHTMLDDSTAEFFAVQFHGFCCPGSGSYAALTHDVVASNGVELVPPAMALVELFAAELDGEAYVCDDGAGGDLTTTAVFGRNGTVLGATNNLQGRHSNGVNPGDVCDTEAVAASQRFLHIEQDPDVREEPLHVIEALRNALDTLTGGSGVKEWREAE